MARNMNPSLSSPAPEGYADVTVTYRVRKEDVKLTVTEKGSTVLYLAPADAPVDIVSVEGVSLPNDALPKKAYKVHAYMAKALVTAEKAPAPVPTATVAPPTAAKPPSKRSAKAAAQTQTQTFDTSKQTVATPVAAPSGDARMDALEAKLNKLLAIVGG